MLQALRDLASPKWRTPWEVYLLRDMTDGHVQQVHRQLRMPDRFAEAWYGLKGWEVTVWRKRFERELKRRGLPAMSVRSTVRVD